MKKLFLALIFFSGAARAQSMPMASTGIPADRFTPGVGPEALLAGETAAVTPVGEVSFSLSLDALGDPLRLTGQLTGSPVSEPVRTQVVGDAAIETGLFRNRIALAIGLPIVIWASGDRLRGTGVDDTPLGAPAAGDLRLRLKAALIGNPARPGLHIGFLVQLTVPAGGQDQFAATDGVTGEPRLVADLRVGRLLMVAALGVRFQPDRPLFASSFGDELTWLAGVSVDLLQRSNFRGGIVAEAAGAASPASHPVELRGALRASAHTTSGDWQLDLGGGAGVVPEPQAPSWRALLMLRWRFAVR